MPDPGAARRRGRGGGPSAGLGQEGCTSDEFRVRLDHVTIAVADLEAAAASLVDGLENRHIKFADRTGFELMTVGEPGDDLARRYAWLIADGGGGAFVALGGLPVDSVLALAAPAEPTLGATPECRRIKERGTELIGASLYLDGHRTRTVVGRVNSFSLTGVDEFAMPGDVAGIEVYAGSGDLPGEFADANAQRCGAVVIWTGI